MPFSIAGGSAMVFICFLDLVGYLARYAATTCGRLGCGHRSDFAGGEAEFSAWLLKCVISNVIP